MERFIKENLWAALVSAALLPVACEKEPVVVEPRLDFENAVVEAPVEGGCSGIAVRTGGGRRVPGAEGGV